MRRSVWGVVVLASSGCVVGAPLGFSGGDNWSIPIVGALENGPMIAPVMINGKGPFLFHLNPDSKTVIDPRLASDLGLYMKRTGTKLVGADDKISEEKLDFVEIKKLSVGNLTVSNVTVVSLPTQSWYRERPVLGIIGSEVLNDTLIWTFDRDRQTVFLATQGHQIPPPEATKVKATRVNHGKLFFDVVLDGHKTDLYIQYSSSVSGVWPRTAASAGLEAAELGWNVGQMMVGDALVRNVHVYPFNDARVRERDYDGILGGDFLYQFNVMINWHKKSLWLQRRSMDLNEHLGDRLGRWGPAFKGCAEPACVTVEVHTGEVSEVIIRREPSKRSLDYDVLLEAVDDAGTPLKLPRLLVAFPPNTDEAAFAGEAALMYTGAARLRVIDATPFPQKCDPTAGRGCVWTTR